MKPDASAAASGFAPGERDADYFLTLQTRTGWGQVLAGFAAWCAPQPGWRTLDVGCGPGLLPALLQRQGCWAVGADLDSGMFAPAPLHSQVLLADGLFLPFATGQFDLVTASNLLFLLADPLAVLRELQRAARAGGLVCLLNPSEKMSVAAAQALAAARGLDGLAQASLLNWAQRAEQHQRWDEAQMQALLGAAGLALVRSALRMGPGLARFSCAQKVGASII